MLKPAHELALDCRFALKHSLELGLAKAAQCDVGDALHAVMAEVFVDLANAVAARQDGDDLFAAIGQQPGQLDQPGNDDGDQVAGFFLVNDLLMSGKLTVGHHAGKPVQAGAFEIGTNGQRASRANLAQLVQRLRHTCSRNLQTITPRRALQGPLAK
jgi:hypothetical protein